MQSLEPVRPDNQPYKPTPIQTAWVALASRYEPWDIFVTLTFVESIHEEEATKRYYRFIRKINQRLFGRNYDRREGVSWVKVMEWQRRGVLHYHSLIGNGAWRLLRIGITDLWENDTKYKRSRNGANGKAWTEKFDPERGSGSYLVKYLTKNKQDDIDIFIPYCMRKDRGLVPDANRQFKFLNGNDECHSVAI